MGVKLVSHPTGRTWIESDWE